MFSFFAISFIQWSDFIAIYFLKTNYYQLQFLETWSCNLLIERQAFQQLFSQFHYRFLLFFRLAHLLHLAYQCLFVP